MAGFNIPQNAIAEVSPLFAVNFDEFKTKIKNYI